MKRISGIGFSLVFLVVAAAGFFGYRAYNGAGPAYELEHAIVENGPVQMTVETSGTVEPLSQVQVGCEVTGKIIEMPVDHDQPVKKDQVICRIDQELADADHQQSTADLARARSALADAKLALDELKANLPIATRQALAAKEEAEANLVDAEYQWERVDELYRNNNAPKAEWIATKARLLRAQAAVHSTTAAYELAKLNESVKVKRAEQAISQAEATLKQAEARFELTKTRVERCTINSPIDGIVLKRYFDPGTTVNAAFQTPILFLLAPALDEMRVSAKVGESDISHIQVGQKARFTIEGRHRQTFEGIIEERRNQPDIINNVVTYTVGFRVKNDEARTLIPGLTVNVVIEIVNKPDVPRIANAALRFKPPLPIEERQKLIAAVKWPDQPERDSTGAAADYCTKSFAWQYEEKSRTWRVVPLWVGVTDNVITEILSGATPGENFVRRFTEKSGGGFDLKEVLKQARPDNRTL